MDKITIKPSQVGIISRNIIIIAINIGLILFPIFDWSSPGILGSLIYLLMLISVSYITFGFVIQAFFAELSFENEKITFKTLGQRKEKPLSEIIDLDFVIYDNHRGKQQGLDNLFFLAPGASTTTSWNIASGWRNEEMGFFTQAVRNALTNLGITAFPLLNKGNYDSSQKDNNH